MTFLFSVSADEDLDAPAADLVAELEQDDRPESVQPVVPPRRQSASMFLSPMNLTAPLAQSDNSLASERDSARTPIEPPPASEPDVTDIGQCADGADQHRSYRGSPAIAADYADSVDVFADNEPPSAEQVDDALHLAASYIETAEKEAIESTGATQTITAITDIPPDILQEIINQVREALPLHDITEQASLHSTTVVEELESEPRPAIETVAVPAEQSEPAIEATGEPRPIDSPDLGRADRIEVTIAESGRNVEEKSASKLEPQREPQPEPQPESMPESKPEPHFDSTPEGAPKPVPRQSLKRASKVGLETARAKEPTETPYELERSPLPPSPPPRLSDYSPLSEVPSTSVYRLRAAGVSEDVSSQPDTMQKLRLVII